MKIYKVFLLCLALCWLSFACQPPTPPVVTLPQDTAPKPIWTMSRDGGSGVYGWFPQFIFGGNLITYTKKNGVAYIVAFNKNTGQEVWAWSDLFNQHEAKTDFIHIFDNILVWRSIRRVYAINLLSGQTVWKQNIDSQVAFGTDEISGLGPRIIFQTFRTTYFSGNVLTGNITANPILQPNVSMRTNHGATKVFLNAPPNFLPQAALNDNLAVLPYGNEQATFFTIYNLTKNQEIYTKTIPGDTSGVFSYSPSVHNGKIYFPAGAFVLCFDLTTGNELWRARLRSVVTSALLIVNNKIYITDENHTTHCFDTESGKALWKTGTRGGASRPFYMNGVIYFTSIADGHLYGLDAEDGKILMKIDDPRGGIGFGDMVAGADGKIYANTYTHLYCFKAAR